MDYLIEVNPLKQGLKHDNKVTDHHALILIEVNPLKQGLKPLFVPVKLNQENL